MQPVQERSSDTSPFSSTAPLLPVYRSKDHCLAFVSRRVQQTTMLQAIYHFCYSSLYADDDVTTLAASGIMTGSRLQGPPPLEGTSTILPSNPPMG